jgi:hypothetical protein
VCARWGDLDAFVMDMGEPPDDKTLDRIDNDGNYEPSNCRWADGKTQSRDQVRYVELDGLRLSLDEWANRLDITKAALNARLARWSVEDALTRPRHHKARVIREVDISELVGEEVA